MRSVLALGLVAVLSIAGSAQLPTSTLNGTVTDPQSAAVANAKVSIISQATGAVRETTTDTAGFYSVTNLLPADYTLRVEIPTFAKSEIKNIRLEVGRASTVDVKLAIAQVGEMVTVQAEEAQVNRDEGDRLPGREGQEQHPEVPADVNVTWIDPAPFTAIVGVPGTVTGGPMAVIVLDAAERAPWLAPLTPATLKKYVPPGVNPVTVQPLAGAD